MKRSFAIFSLLILSIFLFGCLNLGGNASNLSNSTTANGGIDPRFAKLGVRLTIAERNFTSVRPEYFGPFTSQVFSKLPPMPRDFYEIDLLVTKGLWSNTSYITRDYWIQPEFYPEFEAQGVELMLNPPTGRFGAFGYGTYPSELVVLTYPGAHISTAFFVHTSWLVETYQGMGFELVYPANGFLRSSDFPNSDNRTVTQDQQVVRRYIRGRMSPSYAVFGPAYPAFDENWAHKIEVNLDIDPNTPPGRYIVGADIVAPPADKAEEWFTQYKSRYTSAGGTGIGTPWFSMFIEVGSPLNSSAG